MINQLFQLLNFKRNYKFQHKDIRQYKYRLNKYYE